jgi:hypothetical protein
MSIEFPAPHKETDCCLPTQNKGFELNIAGNFWNQRVRDLKMSKCVSSFHAVCKGLLFCVLGVFYHMRDLCMPQSEWKRIMTSFECLSSGVESGILSSLPSSYTGLIIWTRFLAVPPPLWNASTHTNKQTFNERDWHCGSTWIQSQGVSIWRILIVYKRLARFSISDLWPSLTSLSASHTDRMATGWTVGVRIPAGERDFSLPHNVHIG